MKKIIFVRHGKAEDQGSDITDFERSLTSKGKAIARLMAQKMKDVETDPGLIITSPAFRALETAIIFAECYAIKAENIRIDSNLYYHMDVAYLMKVLRDFDENIHTVTFFGHNPSFTMAANAMVVDKIDYLPKTAVAGISFKSDTWKGIKAGSGKLDFFLKPNK
jgi:phosphohistidine phosphatase